MSATDGSSARSRSRSRGAICWEYDDGGEIHRMRLNQALDPSDPNWIEEIERDARSFDGGLPELRLPGSGERLDDCGDSIPALYCPDCASSTEVGRTCRRSACPRCNESWAFNSATTDASKSEALRRLRVARDRDRDQKLHHIVVSPPQSLRFDSSEPLNRGKELVKCLMGVVNVDAGNIYYHSYRIAEEYRGDVAGHSSGSGDMTWADVLRKIESESWSWEAVRDEFLVYAPHFHIIGNSEFVQCGAITEQLFEQTGIVIHRITKPESSVSIYGLEDLCRATAYCLSHTGLQWDSGNEQFRAATWRFGETANLSPSDKVSEKVDNVMRAVSQEVLGVDFCRSGCSSESFDPDSDPDTEAVEWNEESNPTSASGFSTGPVDDRSLGASAPVVTSGSPGLSSSGSPSGELVADGGTWDETRGVVPAYLDDPTESERLVEDRETERCGADLLPMVNAPQHLNDDGWCNQMGADRVDRLRDDYLEWQESGAPPPD